MQPIHLGVFALAFHDWDEPIREVLTFGKEQGVDVVLPKMGEIVRVDEWDVNDRWYPLDTD